MAHSHTPAVIFDLDGTLVDSEPNYHQATREVLANHGVPEFSWREHEEFIGIGTRETLQTLRQRYALSAPLGQLLAEKNDSYLRLARAGTAVFPRMRTLVESLRRESVPVMVASGSSRAAIAAVLEGTGLSKLLPTYLSAEEVPHGKPEPDVFLEAARTLEARQLRRCVVVEDAPPGVEAARRAGMRWIYVPSVGTTAEQVRVDGTELVFPGGQRQFDDQRALEWIREGAGVA